MDKLQRETSQDLTELIQSPAVAKIDGIINSYLQADIQSPMGKAILLGGSVQQLSDALTDDLMKGILFLQGTKLGFRTDKDSQNGYPVAVVKNCFIQSMLLGLEPVGNQWNIIAGNMYCTKEGCTHLLKKLDGLKYSVIPGIPKVVENEAGIGALVTVDVQWQYKGTSGKEKLEFVTKGARDSRGKAVTGADAYQGKAERKAKNWLYHYLTGSSVGEGDVDDVIDTYAEEVIADESMSPFEALRKSIGIHIVDEYLTSRGGDAGEEIAAAVEDPNSFRLKVIAFQKGKEK